MSSEVVKVQEKGKMSFSCNETSIQLNGRFVPNSSAHFLSLLLHVICHFVCSRGCAISINSTSGKLKAVQEQISELEVVSVA